MQAAKKTTKVQQYATLRPLASDMGPHRLGASPWKTRYDVTERLMSSGVTLRSFAIVGIAGK